MREELEIITSVPKYPGLLSFFAVIMEKVTHVNTFVPCVVQCNMHSLKKNVNLKRIKCNSRTKNILKLTAVKVKVSQSCPTLCNPMDYTVHGILQARILEWVPFPFSRGSSNSGIILRSLALQADSLPAEPQGKPKNTGVGSVSLLQWIF